MSSGRLQGQTALVTGASQGVGKVIATEFAREDARVVLAARSRERLEETAAQLEAGGGTAIVVTADLGRPADVDALAQRIEAEVGALDVIVANSGIAGPTAELWNTTPEADVPKWDRRSGRPAQHLAKTISTAVRALERNPSFLRLLIVFAAQALTAGPGGVTEVVGRVRQFALERLREQIAIAFGDDPGSPTTDQLARFALAGLDGAFIASQADPTVAIGRLLEPLAPALVAGRHALRSKATGAIKGTV